VPRECGAARWLNSEVSQAGKQIRLPFIKIPAPKIYDRCPNDTYVPGTISANVGDDLFASLPGGSVYSVIEPTPPGKPYGVDNAGHADDFDSVRRMVAECATC